MRYILGSNSEVFCPQCYNDFWEVKVIDGWIHLVCRNCDYFIDWFMLPEYEEKIHPVEIVRKIKTRKD